MSSTVAEASDNLQCTRESEYYTDAGDEGTSVHSGSAETKSSFFSLQEVSILCTSVYCAVSGFVLVATILFVNMDHRTFKDAVVRELGICGVFMTSFFANHSEFVLICVSCTIVVMYIIFALLGTWLIRRVAIYIKRDLYHLSHIFDLMSKLRLGDVPVYVNEPRDIDITKYQRTLLDFYSECVELQKAQRAINDISLALDLFRRALPGAIFKKKSLRELKAIQKHNAETEVGGAQLSFYSGNTASLATSFSGRQHITSHVVGQNEYTASHRNDEARSVVLPSHDCSRRLVESENTKRLNIFEIRSGVESGLKRKKATVVVASLEGFALHVNEDLRYCHYLSEQFLSIIRDIADRYGGTILSATPNRVITVWNAFSDSPNHERFGMQYACDTISTLDSFVSAMVSSMHINLTHVVVATSGYVLAGTVGTKEERAMSVHGACVTLGEELPSLLTALRIKCACTRALYQSCPAVFSCIPMDYVIDADNNQHDIYEIVKTNLPYHERLTEAFHAFRTGMYSVAERMYAAVYDKNPTEWQAFRMRQLCAYLQESGKIYQRHVPQWQLFPVELDVSNGGVTQRYKDSYHWRKPEAGSVEEQLRRAILRRTDTHHASGSSNETNQATATLPFRKESRLTRRNSSKPVQTYTVTEFCDRQGMKFRMSARILGTGANGSVSMGLSQTGALVAIKQIELPMIRHEKMKPLSSVNRRRLQRKGINGEDNVEEALNALINEVGLLSRLRHSNIVGYISCAIVDNKLLLVMELASGGSLYNMLCQFTKVKVNRAKRYLRDVLKGLEYLHRQKIVHRDIKPQNVLLLENGLCKLSDFGTSQSLQKISNASRPEGTPPYIAPEAARGVAEMASDIWSFGIMMAQVLSGSLPWPDAGKLTPHAFLYNVGHIETFVPWVDDRVPNDAKIIIMRCCRRNPSERPSARELLKDTYFGISKSYISSSVVSRHTLCVDNHFQDVSHDGPHVKRHDGRLFVSSF